MSLKSKVRNACLNIVRLIIFKNGVRKMCKLVVVMLQTNATCQLFMNLLLVRLYGYHISDQGYVVSVFILTEGKVLLPLEDLTVEDDKNTCGFIMLFD